jgi:hypothetical protein
MRGAILLVAAGSLLMAAASAQAGVMASVDFNSLVPPSNGGGYGFGYASSTPLPYSITSVARAADDNALQIQGTVPSNQAWWGLVWGSAWQLNSAPAPAAPLSSLTLSFDARAVGGTSLELSVGTHDGDASMANNLLKTISLTSSWQTFTYTLDTFAPSPDNTGTLDAAATYVIFGATLDQSGFGLTPQTVDVWLDNLTLTGPAATIPVPEPASLSLLALGGAALLRRRRW